MRTLLASLAVIAALLGSGCAGPKEPPPSSIKPIDQSVIATVKLNLKTDPDVASCNLDVYGENGLVALRGTVPNQEIKDKAEAIVKKSARVKAVANHVEVKPE